MTAYRFVTLTCDHCGEIFDPGTEIYTRRVRRMAAAIGWQIRWAPNRLMQDWCGTHRRAGDGGVETLEEV